MIARWSINLQAQLLQGREASGLGALAVAPPPVYFQTPEPSGFNCGLEKPLFDFSGCQKHSLVNESTMDSGNAAIVLCMDNE